VNPAGPVASVQICDAFEEVGAQTRSVPGDVRS
jgi:hypothetical protein